MVKRTGPTNVHLRKLIRLLRKVANQYKARIWRYVAELLERPTRQRVEVNLDKIERYARENETIIVPGKVLGGGFLTKPVTVVAWRFSKSAKEKIEKVGGKTMKIEEYIKINPKGSNTRIII